MDSCSAKKSAVPFLHCSIWPTATATVWSDWMKLPSKARFKKGGFAAELAKVRTTLPMGTPIEIWFQDEACIGQKNKITRRWARRGTRPSAPKDQLTKSAYIFGAICPEHGKHVLSFAEGGAGLVLPLCNTETMSLHLIEISLAVAPGAHAAVLMDQAGWHMTGKLEVPANISIIALPAKCPELNPVENI